MEGNDGGVGAKCISFEMEMAYTLEKYEKCLQRDLNENRRREMCDGISLKNSLQFQ
jgi:hypothetical protein